MRPARAARDEAGFTLIELLVVLVVLPLVVGAAAVAIITTEKNEPTVSSRLSDSLDSAISSAYYIRDVEAATSVTTDKGATNPAPCGTGDALLVGLQTNGETVSYWETTTATGPEVVRTFCSDPSTPNPPTSTVTVSTGASGSDPAATILPASSASTALGAWADASSVSSVALSVREPASNYTYSLSGTPRAWSSVTAGDPTGGVVPGMLLLGSGSTALSVKGGQLTVNGTIALNAGQAVCPNTSGSLIASGQIVTSLDPPDEAAGDHECGGLTPTANPSDGAWTTTSTINDPLAPFLSNLALNPFPGPFQGPAQATGGSVLQPGEYTSFALSGESPVYLEPGIYVLDNGMSLNNSSLSMASDAPAGSGVLFYIPCGPSPDSWTTSCSGSFSINNSSVTLPPLSASQSSEYFGSTAEAGLFLWQNAGDSSAISINGPAVSFADGVVYAPSATMTLPQQGSLSLGAVITAGFSMQNGTVTVLGP